jgi:hypothetical protein
MKTHEVSEELLKEIYDDVSQDVKSRLKEEFPDVFSDLFCFERGHTITTHPNGPLFIGMGMAPKELRNKCLIVNRTFKMETFEYEGHTILKFIKI